MNPEEKLLSESEIIFTKILNDVFKKMDEEEEKQKSKKNDSASQPSQYRDYHIGIYNQLVEKIELLKTTNSPKSETIKSLARITNHISELVETRQNSTRFEDQEFCQAITNLKNSTIDYRLWLEREYLMEDNLEVSADLPKGRKNEVLDYNRTELNQSQLLFLFNQMRKQRMITSNISNIEIARAVEILTGNSEKKFSQKLSGVDKIEFSKQEKEQLKSKLDKLDKAVD
ncbi:MAG: hypothetical protein EOO43_20340, partial [Flavobacterium sp.]